LVLSGLIIATSLRLFQAHIVQAVARYTAGQWLAHRQFLLLLRNPLGYMNLRLDITSGMSFAFKAILKLNSLLI